MADDNVVRKKIIYVTNKWKLQRKSLRVRMLCVQLWRCNDKTGYNLE